jgi:hypothetical protein
VALLESPSALSVFDQLHGISRNRGEGSKHLLIMVDGGRRGTELLLQILTGGERGRGADCFARIFWKMIPFCGIKKSAEAVRSSIVIVVLASSRDASNSSRISGFGVPGGRGVSGGGEERTRPGGG